MAKFEGFEIPTKNFFHMPNNWTDITSEIDNLAELKVVEYVMRHTWGYKEYGISKTISVDEFMKGRRRQDGTRIDKGTGLKSDRSVKDGLKLAIQHGYIICEVDTSDLGRTKKSYALHMTNTGVDTTPQVEDTPGVEDDTQTGRYYPSEGYNLPPRQVDTTPRTEKDTVERQLGNKPQKEVKAINSVKPSNPPKDITSNTGKKEKPVITLTTEEQTVFDEWCQMKWFHGVTPDLQVNDPEYLRKLAAYNPTVETMYKVRNWATSKEVDRNGWYKKTGWSLYALAKEYPKWLSTQIQEPEEPKPNNTRKDFTGAGAELRRAREEREAKLKAGGM